MRRNVVAAVAVVVLVPAPLVAHHAFSAEFDINKPLTLEGKLVQWEMINPHSWFHLEVVEEDRDLFGCGFELNANNQVE